MKLNRIPFVLLLILIWIGLRMGGLDVSAGSIAGIVLMVLCFIVLIIEFYKSADIGLRTFKLEMAGTVLNTVLATFLVSRYVALNDIHTGDVFVMVVVLVDAWLGPVASFAMALRNVSANLGVGGNSSES